MTPEEGKRWRKVAKIIAALYAHCIPIEFALGLGEQGWRIVAKTLGLNEPSLETIDRVLEVLTEARKTTDAAQESRQE